MHHRAQGPGPHPEAGAPSLGVGDLLVFYGSLMSGLHPAHQPDFHSRLRFEGEVTLAGELYRVLDGDWSYPGLILGDPGAGLVTAELWRIEDDSVGPELDEWEMFEPADPDSVYLRRLVRTLDPAVDAWVYIGNHADTSHRVGGSWRRWLEEQQVS